MLASHLKGLDIFEESGMIKIIEKNEDDYIIKFITGIEISKTLHTNKYSEFIELMNTVLEYKNTFMTIDI